MEKVTRKKFVVRWKGKPFKRMIPITGKERFIYKHRLEAGQRKYRKKLSSLEKSVEVKI